MRGRIGCAFYAAVVLLKAVTSTGDLTRELELVASDSEALTLVTQKTAQMQLNFTLYCVHSSVTYTLAMTAGSLDVARVQGQHAFDISCVNSTYPPYTDLAKNIGMTNGGVDSNQGGQHEGANSPSSYSLLSPRDSALLLPRVEGTLTYVLHAGLLGKTRLRVWGTRRVRPGIELPDFLQLPWSSGAGHGGKLEFTKGNSSESETSPSSLPSSGGEAERLLVEFVVTTVRVSTATDVVFRAVLAALVFASTAGVGLQTELALTKSVLRRPLVPAVGFLCQSLVVPLIAFALARTVSPGDSALSLGIFACGISPGGVPSNLFTFLLDGDVSLAVVMATISTIAAIAMIPLWLFTLGATFHDDLSTVRVPYDRTLIILLILLVVPFFLGLLVRNRLQKVSKAILKGLKPLPFLTSVFLVTFGIYAKLDLFLIYSRRALLTGCLLPYVGYLIGGVTGVILRQPFNRVKTIAIETGVQNTSLAYVLLLFSLPVPLCDVASLAPLTSAIITPLPVFLTAVLYLVFKKVCKRRKAKDKMTKDEAKEHDEVESDEKDIEEHSRIPLNASHDETASTEAQSASKQDI